jgi:hypothetical protein
VADGCPTSEQPVSAAVKVVQRGEPLEQSERVRVMTPEPTPGDRAAERAAKEAAFERELEERAAAYLQEKVPDESADITLRALDAQLAHMLEAIIRDPGEWILIIEATPERYIQFLASENDRLVTECVSSEFLPPEAAWSEEAEQRISQLGWLRPKHPDPQNWQVIDFGEQAALRSAGLCLPTLRLVFGCRDDDLLRMYCFPA